MDRYQHCGFKRFSWNNTGLTSHSRVALPMNWSKQKQDADDKKAAEGRKEKRKKEEREVEEKRRKEEQLAKEKQQAQSKRSEYRSPEDWKKKSEEKIKHLEGQLRKPYDKNEIQYSCCSGPWLTTPNILMLTLVHGANKTEVLCAERNPKMKRIKRQ